MPVHKSIAAAPIGTQRPARSLGWTAAAGLVGGAAILLAGQLPAPLVLPMLSTLLVTAGLALAAGLYLTGHRLTKDRARGWDVAGALVFLGFAAALLTESEQALALLDQMQTHGLAALSK